MVIQQKKYNRVCDACGNSFTTYNVEDFICWDCRKKGLTYIEYPPDKRV